MSELAFRFISLFSTIRYFNVFVNEIIKETDDWQNEFITKSLIHNGAILLTSIEELQFSQMLE